MRTRWSVVPVHSRTTATWRQLPPVTTSVTPSVSVLPGSSTTLSRPLLARTMSNESRPGLTSKFWWPSKMKLPQNQVFPVDQQPWAFASVAQKGIESSARIQNSTVNCSATAGLAERRR